MLVWAAGMPEEAAAATWAYLDLISAGRAALFSAAHIRFRRTRRSAVWDLRDKRIKMLPEMESSLAASSRPSTSYATGLPKPVPSHRHRLAPEQLRSVSSTVGALICFLMHLVIRRGSPVADDLQRDSIKPYCGDVDMQVARGQSLARHAAGSASSNSSRTVRLQHRLVTFVNSVSNMEPAILHVGNPRHEPQH